jgi:hypothetical protein
MGLGDSVSLLHYLHDASAALRGTFPTHHDSIVHSCLHQLQFMMTRIYASLTSSTTDKLPSDYHSHYLHCVDYLRQGIMCSADLTMEPHDVTDADDNGSLDGSWNGHHGKTPPTSIARGSTTWLTNI